MTSSPWPAEDGGPARRAVSGGPGLAIEPDERLELAASRDAFGITMVVLGDAGQVYALRHSMGRRPLKDPCVAWVERVDPATLEPLARTPDLDAGPFWPGGMAVASDGSLHVVFGRYCHRLSAELEVLARRQLPRPRPYNSFVTFGDGTLVMKDFDRELREPALLTLLHPETLERRCEDVPVDEPAIARLAADRDALYVVGATTARRYRWDGERLARDEGWELRYLTDPARQSYGWDPVVAGGQLWFMDNGAHDYTVSMRNAGVAPGPVHLLRVALDDASDHEAVEVCGAPRGAVTDPPLYDEARRIAVAYDSANGVVQAFGFDGSLTPLWRRELNHAAHMVLFADTGELVLHDHDGPGFTQSRLARALGRRGALGMPPAPVRRTLSRRYGDDVVVLDIETGAEKARARVPSLFQSVLFPAAGRSRDVYWCTFSTLARLRVTPADGRGPVARSS